jgi:hypothetical protein
LANVRLTIRRNCRPTFSEQQQARQDHRKQLLVHRKLPSHPYRPQVAPYFISARAKDTIINGSAQLRYERHIMNTYIKNNFNNKQSYLLYLFGFRSFQCRFANAASASPRSLHEIGPRLLPLFTPEGGIAPDKIAASDCDAMSDTAP